jgi:outer membrane protein TolC
MRNIILLCFFANISWGQSVLRFDDFQSQVVQNHPLGKQASYAQKRSMANITEAKAAFDPLLLIENSQKTLGSKAYFNYTLAEVVYQSPYAFKLKSGYEVSSGGFLNPENTPGSLAFLGIELPLLQGLLTDYKRTEIQKAVLYSKQTEAERQATMNTLLLESALAYYDWTANFELFKILDSYLNNSKKRLELVKLGFRNGERAQIDTVEAMIQYQKIVLLKNEANLNFVKSRLALSQFLWTADEKPYFLSVAILPDTLIFDKFSVSNLATDLLAQNLIQHPELQKYEFKQSSLMVTQRLYKQYFLPELTLKANLLNQRNVSPETIFAQPVNENYKFGVDFRFPLLVRDARAKKQEIKFKLLENQNNVDMKRWELENKVRGYGQDIETNSLQFKTLTDMNVSYKLLLSNELLRFTNGESTLFLINTRENTLLENIEKLIKTKLKLVEKSYLQKWAAGKLYE